MKRKKRKLPSKKKRTNLFLLKVVTVVVFFLLLLFLFFIGKSYQKHLDNNVLTEQNTKSTFQLIIPSTKLITYKNSTYKFSFEYPSNFVTASEGTYASPSDVTRWGIVISDKKQYGHFSFQVIISPNEKDHYGHHIKTLDDITFEGCKKEFLTFAGQDAVECSIGAGKIYNSWSSKTIYFFKDGFLWEVLVDNQEQTYVAVENSILNSFTLTNP